MIRILFFLIFVFALAFGFAWLADRPGEMVVTFGGYQYQISLMVAAVAITAVVAAVMVIWWLVKSVWNSPYTIARYFRVRQRDRGYQALSTGMIAAGAGDAALARKMNKQAARLIRSDSEPLIHLLDAQASLLEGDHASAREKFERMLDDPEMRLLGLRGLYLEAERLGDRSAARHYAGRAADIAPQLGWAADSTLEEKTARGDWDGALKLVDAQKSSAAVDREATARRRAVLLTAKAQDLIDTDPSAAKTAALEANRLRPDFAPAAVIAAKVLFKQNDIRKGAKILEAAWKANPHPEVADLYTHARHGDAVLDRLSRARKLRSLKTNNVESALIVAKAALDAKEYAAAREAAEEAIRLDAREAAYLLLADIEEAETGDQGRVRQYLAKALRSPRDPAWVADGVIASSWAPVSPITGRLDAFEWRMPMERLGQLIEADGEELHPALAAPAVIPPPSAVQPDDDIDTVDLSDEPVLVAVATPAAEPVSARPVESPTAAVVAEPGPQPVPRSVPEPLPEPAPEQEPVELGRLPDDPGVDPDEEREKSTKRFRLF